MTTPQIEALKKIMVAIHETVKEEPHGAPSGHVYAALMGIMSYETYEMIINAMIKNGKLERKNHLLFAK